MANKYYNWKWEATKTKGSQEVKEELTYPQVAKLMMSGTFMIMLKRMRIGEELFYNENGIKFKRIE